MCWKRENGVEREWSEMADGMGMEGVQGIGDSRVLGSKGWLQCLGIEEEEREEEGERVDVREST